MGSNPTPSAQPRTAISIYPDALSAVDTSVAIDHLRGAQPAVDLLQRLIDEEQPVLASEVVRFELLAGVRDDELEASTTLCRFEPRATCRSGG